MLKTLMRDVLTLSNIEDILVDIASGFSFASDERFISGQSGTVEETAKRYYYSRSYSKTVQPSILAAIDDLSLTDDDDTLQGFISDLVRAKHGAQLELAYDRIEKFLLDSDLLQYKEVASTVHGKKVTIDGTVETNRAVTTEVSNKPYNSTSYLATGKSDVTADVASNYTNNDTTSTNSGTDTVTRSGWRDLPGELLEKAVKADLMAADFLDLVFWAIDDLLTVAVY